MVLTPIQGCRLIAIFLSLLVSSIVGPIPVWAAKFNTEVVDITDGDTITVVHKIRLADIDCPEKSQEFGEAAKQFTSDLVLGKPVLVDILDVDRYKRPIAHVELFDGRSLNRELIRAGYAWCYDKYCNDKTVKDLETEARQASRGLWVAQHPLPPWQFRHDQRNSGKAEILQVTEIPVQTSSSYVLAQKPANNKSRTVIFNTKSHVYHNPSCNFAIRCTKNCISLPLSEAIARGGRPCSYCGGSTANM